MKILTLNTHSIQEPDYPAKLDRCVRALIRQRPDIIAMQEVNQTAQAPVLPAADLAGRSPVPGSVPIRRDNHAAAVARGLRQAGIDCFWAWLPVKLGYGKYDEGLALMSLGAPIAAVDLFPVSRSTDYVNWRTRAALGIQVQGRRDWFYCVHLGWWEDPQEPFRDQWSRLQTRVAGKRLSAPLWLLGDFNAPDSLRGQSYDLVARSGWMDTYQAAAWKDDGITVPGPIDGWQDTPGQDPAGMRLDYIWCSRQLPIRSSQVVFNGINGPIVSDHFGVLAETTG